MGIEEICNTGLSLGLGSFESTHKNQVHHHQHNNKFDHLFPSLSLALSSEVLTKEAAKLKRQTSSLSMLSSFSNSTSTVKRERDIVIVSGEAEEDLEVDKVVDLQLSSSKIISSSSDHDHDQEYFGPRKKLRLNKDQSFVLEESFKEHSTLNPKQKQVLAKRLNLLPRQVEVWFQNRRARTKLKQTEVEFEMIKKYSEALTEENRRLKKEVQDLKALKICTTQTASASASDSSSQFYTTAATITLCPSCQRISNSTPATSTSSSRSQYFSSNPQFYAYSSAPNSYSTTLQTT